MDQSQGDRAVPLLFDAAREDHVLVHAQKFFFEPYGAEFVPPSAGAVVVCFGDSGTRHRGVEVSFLDDETASVSVPGGGRVWWLPSLLPSDPADRPWEHRLHALDHETGELVT